MFEKYKDIHLGDSAYLLGSGPTIKDFSVEELMQFGKKVFATWFDVKADQTKKLELKYVNPYAIEVVDGASYQFVFDKQAGVGGELELFIEAPPGYIWKESQSHLFEYTTDAIPAKLVFNLTLFSSSVLR